MLLLSLISNTYCFYYSSVFKEYLYNPVFMFEIHYSLDLFILSLESILFLGWRIEENPFGNLFLDLILNL